jgi:hypothetical protein
LIFNLLKKDFFCEGKFVLKKKTKKPKQNKTKQNNKITSKTKQKQNKINNKK